MAIRDRIIECELSARGFIETKRPSGGASTVSTTVHV